MGNLALVESPSIVDVAVVDGGKGVEVVLTMIELASATEFGAGCESEL